MPDTNEPLLEREKQVYSPEDEEYYKKYYKKIHKNYLKSMAENENEKDNENDDGLPNKTFYHNGDTKP